MKEEILFLQDKKQITDGDILRLLAGLGIKQGDVLMIHSDLVAIGRPPENFLKKRELFLTKVLNLFKKSVGPEGTILMPTFTYSFMRSELYDLNNTPSTAGVLTEFFRKQKDVIRTPNPNLSFAVWGKEKDFFIKGLSHDSYGPDSVFGKMLKKKAKILLFGASFKGGTTFVHHIEYMLGVPYRYKKLTHGPIRMNGKIFYDTYEHSMRFQDKYVTIDAYRKAGEYLRKKDILKEAKLGYRTLELVDTEEYFKEGLKLLKKDPAIFLNDKFFSLSNSFTVSTSVQKQITLMARRLKDNRPHEDIYIHGLDKGEVEIRYRPSGDKDDKLGLAMFYYLAEFLKNMGVQLKWSYRLTLGRSSEKKSRFVLNFTARDLKEEKVANILNQYLERIYEIEHDMVLSVAGKSKVRLDLWLKTQKNRKILHMVFALLNGKRSLSDISLKSGIGFKVVRSAADMLLRQGFLNEIANI